MTAAQKNEITIFGTQAQKDEVRSSNWFEPSKHIIAISDHDFERLLKNIELERSSIFIALSKSVFTHFLKYLIKNLTDETLVRNFHRSKPSLISFKIIDFNDEEVIVDDLFEDVIFDKQKNLTLLKKEQLMFILSKPLSERRDRIIGIQILKNFRKIKLLKGDFESLYVPMDIFKPSTQNITPDYNDIEIMEYGHYIRLGEYEASASGILYECDKDYRLRRKKERLENEISFGACLRRYRIQKKIRQTDFKNTAEKTIRRIEDGDAPTETTKSKILNELEITEDELMTF